MYLCLLRLVVFLMLLTMWLFLIFTSSLPGPPTVPPRDSGNQPMLIDTPYWSAVIWTKAPPVEVCYGHCGHCVFCWIPVRRRRVKWEAKTETWSWKSIKSNQPADLRSLSGKGSLKSRLKRLTVAVILNISLSEIIKDESVSVFLISQILFLKLPQAVSCLFI